MSLLPPSFTSLSFQRQFLLFSCSHHFAPGNRARCRIAKRQNCDKSLCDTPTTELYRRSTLHWWWWQVATPSLSLDSASAQGFTGFSGRLSTMLSQLLKLQLDDGLFLKSGWRVKVTLEALSRGPQYVLSPPDNDLLWLHGDQTSDKEEVKPCSPEFCTSILWLYYLPKSDRILVTLFGKFTQIIWGSDFLE